MGKKGISVVAGRLAACEGEMVGGMVGADRRQPHPELSMAKMQFCRVRYFTDGAEIGSKEFVCVAFAGAWERFTEKRKNGARRMMRSGAAAKGVWWSIRD